MTVRLREIPMNRRTKKPLTVDQILFWADAHHERTGRWPSQWSGPIKRTTSETWHNVDKSLCHGGRGLTGGSSLSKILARHRGKIPGFHYRPRLTIKQILVWAD